MTENKADSVDITLHEITVRFENQTYPAPTREDIAKKVIEILHENKFSYSEKRYSHPSVSEQLMNDLEPISSPLETFGELEEAMEQARAMQKDISTSIGRDSKEQGGTTMVGRKSAIPSQYNTDHDPLNED